MSSHTEHKTPAGNSGRKPNRKKDYSSITRVLLGLCIAFGIVLCVLVGLKIKEDAGAERHAQTLLEAYKEKEENSSAATPENTAETAAEPETVSSPSIEEAEPEKAETKTEIAPVSTAVMMENEDSAPEAREKTSDELRVDASIAQEGEANRYDAEHDDEVDELAEYVAPEEPTEEEALTLIDQIVNAVGDDGVIGIIEIPKYGQEYPIIGQWSYKLLKISVCRYKGPKVNEKGNLVLIGHNYKSGAHFGNLKKLKVGDEIYLTAPGSDMRVRYEIYNISNIEPDNFAAVDKTKGDCGLTLMTCTNQGNRRKVVRCVRKAATSDVDTVMNAKNNPFTT